jgi:hypothetical protein
MKLKLNLDQLAVDSFDTCVPAKEKGTVFGEQCTCPGVTCAATCPATCAYTCDDATCPQCPTCNQSCNGSCDCSYDYTCEGCTLYDGTCRGYGTCGIYPCRPIP